MERQCALPGCDKVVTGKRMTCSAAHRQAWSRYRKRAAAHYDKIGEAEKPPDAADLASGMDPVEVALEVFRQELTPHVRAAITDDTIKAIGALVSLHPQLIESLGKDLTNPDSVARGRAQSLIAKYTLGFIDPKNDKQQGQLVINLGNMPSPDNPGALPVPPEDINELRECDRCGEEKVVAEFHEDATRCYSCQAEIKRELSDHYERG